MASDPSQATPLWRCPHCGAGAAGPLPPPADPRDIPVLSMRWDVYQERIAQAREQGRQEAEAQSAAVAAS